MQICLITNVVIVAMNYFCSSYLRVVLSVYASIQLQVVALLLETSLYPSLP